MLNVPLLRAKAEPEPAAVAIPASELEAITGGGLAVLRELPGICEHAKKRLRQSDRPIVQADLDELLHMLAEAKERIDAEMAEISASPRKLTTLRLRPFGTKQAGTASSSQQSRRPNRRRPSLISRSERRRMEPKAQNCCTSSSSPKWMSQSPDFMSS